MGNDDVVSSMVLELRRGTLVMLVLSQLRTPAYGYALVKSLADHGIPIEANTLYPLMRRLEAQGLLTSEWDHAGSKPRKYYRTTDEGLRVLHEVEAQWRTLCEGVGALLEQGAEGDAGRNPTQNQAQNSEHIAEQGTGQNVGQNQSQSSECIAEQDAGQNMGQNQPQNSARVADQNAGLHEHQNQPGG